MNSRRELRMTVYLRAVAESNIVPVRRNGKGRVMHRHTPRQFHLNFRYSTSHRATARSVDTAFVENHGTASGHWAQISARKKVVTDDAVARNLLYSTSDALGAISLVDPTNPSNP
jgi:hypothetical protein